jgi:uncharacterized protein (DUF1501 family)
MTDHTDDHDHSIAPHLKEALTAGCAESRLLLSRRALLGVSAGLFSWASLPRQAEAFEGDPRLLVVVLRGGMDGVHVAYHASEAERLRSLRGRMFEQHSPGSDYLASYLALGQSGFRLNGQMTNLAAWYAAGQASLVHAVAPPLRNRSHFDCQDNLENGQPSLGNPTRDGWLNRFLAGLGNTELMRNALGGGTTPLILKGDAPVNAWSGAVLQSLGDGFTGNLLESYAASGNILFQKIGRNLASGAATQRQATAATAASMAPSQPTSALANSFRGTARLMRQEAGSPRIAVLSVGGLDTHSGQILLLDQRLKELDQALGAFRSELGEPVWSKTLVVCVTEFGRTLNINANGTDHGTGTLAFLAGGNVQGGKVISDWPGLTALQDARDLKATTDTRALFKAILRDHLGMRDMTFLNTRVFPESSTLPPLPGLIRTPAPRNLIRRG